MTYTDAEKLYEVQREVQMRRQVYPSRVRKGLMTDQQATRQIGIMEEIASEYLGRLQPRLALETTG